MRRQLGRRLIIKQKRDTKMVSLFCLIVFRKREVKGGIFRLPRYRRVSANIVRIRSWPSVVLFRAVVQV